MRARLIFQSGKPTGMGTESYDPYQTGNTVDGRNSEPPKKPLFKPLFVGICRAIINIPGLLRWTGLCPSTVLPASWGAVAFSWVVCPCFCQDPPFSTMGVLFGCFGRKNRWPWFTGWFNHPPGPSISPKRTPMFSTRC